MAMAIDSYANLKQAVLEAAEDTSDEINSYFPVALDNAEQRLLKELDVLGLKAITTVTASASSPTFRKPSGYRLGFSLAYIDPTTSAKTLLRKKTDDYLDEYWPNPTSVGTPKFYADEDNLFFRIAPSPISTVNVEVKYLKRPTALTSANPTNYYTDFASDALFYATMIEIGIWQRNDMLTAKFSEMYVAARDSLNNEGRRQRRDDGINPANPEVGQNTLFGKE